MKQDIQIIDFQAPYRGNPKSQWVQVVQFKGNHTYIAGVVLSVHGDSKTAAIEAALKIIEKMIKQTTPSLGTEKE